MFDFVVNIRRGLYMCMWLKYCILMREIVAELHSFKEMWLTLSFWVIVNVCESDFFFAIYFHKTATKIIILNSRYFPTNSLDIGYFNRLFLKFSLNSRVMRGNKFYTTI